MFLFVLQGHKGRHGDIENTVRGKWSRQRQSFLPEGDFLYRLNATAHHTLFWDHKAATRVPKMTKVDIEGSELGALPEWIESGALEKVDPKTWTKRDRETCYELGRLHI